MEIFYWKDYKDDVNMNVPSRNKYTAWNSQPVFHDSRTPPARLRHLEGLCPIQRLTRRTIQNFRPILSNAS